MRLICPNCATQYEVADSDIPVAGRVVQCGICENEWTATRPLTPPAEVEQASEVPAAIPTAPRSEISSAIADALGEQPAAPPVEDSALDSRPDSPVDFGQGNETPAPDAVMPAEEPTQVAHSTLDEDDYAQDDHLSADDESDDEQGVNASDFDAEALRSLLAQQVSARRGTDTQPAIVERAEDTAEIEDHDDLLANVMDAVAPEARPDAAPAQEDVAAYSDTVQADIVQADAVQADAVQDQDAPELDETEPDTTDAVTAISPPADELTSDDLEPVAQNAPDQSDLPDFSIPPVPRDDTVRASADAAFEAMRARRAERRAAREQRGPEDSDDAQTGHETALSPQPEPADTPAEMDESDSVLADLRRILNEPETDVAAPAAAPVDEGQRIAEDTVPDTSDAVETLPEIPVAPVRERPQRPGRPGAPDPVAEPAPEQVTSTRPARPTRPGRPAAAEIAMPVADDIAGTAEIDLLAPAEDTAARSAGRAGLGFVVAIMLALLAAMIYVLADQLSAIVPALASALQGYESVIDGLRATVAGILGR